MMIKKIAFVTLLISVLGFGFSTLGMASGCTSGCMSDYQQCLSSGTPGQLCFDAYNDCACHTCGLCY